MSRKTRKKRKRKANEKISNRKIDFENQKICLEKTTIFNQNICESNR